MTHSPLHLWCVELDARPEDEAACRGLLSADELARAERLADARAYRRFVVTRGTLRNLLGDRLGEHPRSVPIEEGPSGKPRLGGGGRLRFNVSHSGDLALVCIVEGTEVGVDLEGLRPVPDASAIARRRFSPAEASFIEGGQGGVADGGVSDVDRRFLRCWTRKEAILKAMGAGLDFDLRSFTVPLDPAGGVVELDDPGGGAPRRWRLIDVPVGAGHMAALAAEIAR